jgi:hypothetical protein
MKASLPPTGSRPQAAETTAGGGKADVWGWVAVTLCTAAALLAGLVESVLIPLYIGSVPIPLAPVLAVALNVVLVWTGRVAVGRALGGLLPLLGWLVPVLVLSGVQRPERDVIYIGGDGWLPVIGYAVVLGGGLAGAVTLVLTASVPPPRPSRGGPIGEAAARPRR